MSDADRYNSMQQSAGILPPFPSMPVAPTSAQVSAQAAAMGAAQLSQMMAVTQLGQQSMGPFGSPMFPQLQTPFVGSPGVMPGPGGSYYPMTPAGSASPYQTSMGAGQMGMAGQMSPPGSAYVATPPAPPPAYRGPMGQPGPAPFFPPAPLSMFDTPYQSAFANSEATSDRRFASAATGAGLAARVGMDAGFGMLGARIGGRMGGGVGAAIGGALGFIGSETSGLGGWGQNSFMENVALPPMNTRAYGGGLERASRGFVSGGPELSGSGMGWSHQASTRAAGMLEDMSQSSSFQKETFGRFNTPDVMRIAQTSSQEGLMSGVQTGTDMKNRVRDLSKSLVSVMELANEPDVIRAIQVMGQMRSSGLNLHETQQAVQQGRTFARMAGTTFEGLANSGGAAGSSVFQSMGLTQGLGMTTGMANQGIAMASQNMGTLSPQLLNLLGGHQGLAGMNNMFSAGMLQMPMMAPGLMNAQGGINTGAVGQMMSGQLGAFGMTGNGTNTMSQMGRSMGVGGLGMSLALQPMLQDSIGRMVQSQGPFAQRHMEDRQMMNLMRNMGMRGSEGFVTAAQMMGMSGTQAISRAQELADPRHFTQERQQIAVNRMDRRSEELREREAQAPSTWDDIKGESGSMYGLAEGARGAGRALSSASQWLAGGRPNRYYQPSSREEVQRVNSVIRSSSYGEHLRDMPTGRGETNWMDGIDNHFAAQRYYGRTGLASLFGAGIQGLTAGGRRDMELANMDQRAMGRFTGTMLTATRGESNAAAGRDNELFGSSHAADRFSQRVGALYAGGGGSGVGHAFSAGVDIASQLPSTPGSLLGGVGGIYRGRQTGWDDVRQAYVRNQREAGDQRSEQELMRLADSNRSTLAARMGPGMRWDTTNAGYGRIMRDNAEGMNVGGGGRGVDLEGNENRTYSSVMRGAGDARSRRQVDQLFTGFNVTSVRSDQRGEANAYLAARSTLTLQTEDPTKREAATSQIARLDAEAQRRGLNVRDLRNRNAQRIVALGRDEDVVDAAQNVYTSGTGAQIMDRFRHFSGKRDESAADRQMSDGYRALGNRGGAVGALFRGVTEGGRLDEDRLRQTFASVSGNDDRMAELRASDPRMAGLVQQYGSASTDAQREAVMSRVRQTAAGFSNVTAAARSRYDRLGVTGRFSAAHGIYNGLRDAFGGQDSYVDRHSGGGTSADRDADRQTSDSLDMEDSASGSGMGGAADRLVRAAESIERAANDFRAGVRDQNMNDILPVGR